MSSVPVEGPTGLPRALGRRVPGGRFAIVAVVVTAVLLISVGVGVLVAPGSAPRATGAITFYSARSVAQSALGPGNWSLAGAFGVDLWNSTSLPGSGNLSYPAGCIVTTSPQGSPSALEVPAYRGILSGGTALAWVLEYVDAAKLSEAGVLVINGELAFSVTFQGSGCGLQYAGIPTVPRNVVDSSTAAQSIDAAGASSFLTSNRSGVSLVMDLLPGFGGSSPPLQVPLWTFEFTPCGGLLSGNPSGPASGTGLIGTVNAVTGAVLGAVYPQSVDCVPTANTTSPPAIFEAITFGSATVGVGPGTGGTLASQGCASGDYCYALPVTQAGMNVTPNDMALWLTNNTGVPSLAPRGFAFLDPQGNVLVYSAGAIESVWTSAGGSGTTLLVAGDTLEIDMGPSDPFGMGYSINIQGLGPFYGSSEETSLP